MLMVYMHRDASRARRGSSRDRGEVGEPRRTTCARDRPRRERPSLENGWISLIKQGLEGVHTVVHIHTALLTRIVPRPPPSDSGRRR